MKIKKEHSPTFKNKIRYNTAYTSNNEAVGTVYWNSDEDTLDVKVDTNVTLQVGQEVLFNAKNQTGAQINDGTFVMFAGTVGASGRLLIQKGIADGSLNPEYTMGIATEDIVDGADGKVTWFGKVRGIDTSGTPYSETWNDGDIIYASATTAGALTNVEPAAPNRRIIVAAVINAHANNGTLMVRPTWHPKLAEIDDIAITSIADNDLLQYDSASQTWQNKTLSSIADGTYLRLDTSNDPLTRGLTIDGTQNENQLIVQGHSTQTSNLQEWQASNTAGLAFMTSAGYFQATKIAAGSSNDSWNNVLYAIGGPMVFDYDSSGFPPSQFTLRGQTNTNKQLLIGFNTSLDFASIQAIEQGAAFRPLALNPLSGFVGVGIYNPSAKLHVVGDTNDNQLVVKAHSTQTATIVEFRDSSDNAYFALGATPGAEGGRGYVNIYNPTTDGSGSGFVFNSNIGTKSGIFSLDGSGNFVFRNYNTGGGTFFDFNTGGLYFRNESLQTMLFMDRYGSTIIETHNSGAIPLTLKAEAGTGGNVFEVKDSDNNVFISTGLATNNPEGRGFIKVYNPTSDGTGAGFTFKSAVGLTNTGFFQLDGSGNMVFRNSQGGTFFDFNSGGLYFRNSSLSTLMLFDNSGNGTFTSLNASTVPITIKAHASQTGNLQAWSNSSGTVGLAIAANTRDFILDTTTGSKIGTSTSQKLGFYNATPITQPTEITDELTTITHTAPGTPDYAIQDLVDSASGSAFGFATKDEGNTVLSVIANLQARVNGLETTLVNLGLLADAD